MDIIRDLVVVSKMLKNFLISNKSSWSHDFSLKIQLQHFMISLLDCHPSTVDHLKTLFFIHFSILHASKLFVKLFHLANFNFRPNDNVWRLKSFVFVKCLHKTRFFEVKSPSTWLETYSADTFRLSTYHSCQIINTLVMMLQKASFMFH